MALDERAFFNEKPETRSGKYQCPKCRRTNDYSIRWVRRSKKDRPPAGADEADKAKFAKLRDYLLRVRSGEFEYDELVAKAEQQLVQVQADFASCSLPEEPDRAQVNALLVRIREEFALRV